MNNGSYKLEKKAWPSAYAEIADAMSELRSRFPKPIVLACSIVHPRHSIPAEHLDLLMEIRRGTPINLPGVLSLLMKWGICLLSALYDTAWLALLKLRFGFIFRRRSRGGVDVLMKTWMPGPDGFTKPVDFYYGSMHGALTEGGMKPLILAGDGRSDDGRLFSKFKTGFKTWEFVSAASKLPDQRAFPEIMLTPVWLPVATSFAQLGLSFRLRSFASQQSAGVIKRLAARAAVDALRPYTTKNYCFYRVAFNAVRRFHPKIVLTFFEGQPWEKLFWLGARRADPEVKIAGYQHTVVMPHSFALLKPFASEWEVSVPDLVLCTGEKTKHMLDAVLEARNVRCRVVGSHRRAPGPGLQILPRPDLKTVLVLPEGILSEAITLFNFAMETAAALPDQKFIFRCHPVLPYEKIEPHLKRKKTDFPNIELSTDPSIDADFRRSSALIYRGSSAALYAVLAGVRPYCLLLDDQPNVDPLFALERWRVYVSDAYQAAEELRAFASSDPAAHESDWRAVAQEVDRLTQPARESSVAAFLKEVL